MQKVKHSLFAVYLTYFLDNFGQAIIYPLFTPLFLLYHPIIPTSYLGKTFVLGALIAIFPFAQLIGAPLLGEFSDRWGRKKAFFITILGTAIGYTLTACSISMHSLLFLFLSRLLTGLFASNLTLCLAAIVDLSPDKKARTHNFGNIAAIGGLSFIGAIAIGTLLSDPSFGKNVEASLPFWITSGLAYINLICMVLLFQESHPEKKGYVHPLKGLHHLLNIIKTKDLLPIYVANFFFLFSWIASTQFLPYFLLQHFTLSRVDSALILTMVGCIWMLMNFVINAQLSKHFPPEKTLRVCLFFLSICLLILLFVDRLFIFFILFYSAVALAALCWPNSLANISLKAAHNIQGGILGINQSMTACAAVISSLLISHFSSKNIEWIFGLTALCSLFAFLILYARNKSCRS